MSEARNAVRTPVNISDGVPLGNSKRVLAFDSDFEKNCFLTSFKNLDILIN